MNHIETTMDYQPKIESLTEKIICDLRQAIKVVNADYQQIDWEDRAFLNRVLNEVLKIFETTGGVICRL